MAEWVRAAASSEVPPGSLKAVELEGVRVVLANVDGTLCALQDRCSHADFPLSDGALDGPVLECAHHGARFDACTGRALSLPAVRPVPALDVELRGADVYVQVDA